MVETKSISSKTEQKGRGNVIPSKAPSGNSSDGKKK